MTYWHTFYRSTIGKSLLGIAAVTALIAMLLITPWGNRMLTPTIERFLSSALSADITVDDWLLQHDRFGLAFHDTRNNKVSVQGGYSLLTLRMYAHYRINCQNSGGMNPLATPFKSDGALSGGFSALDIHGNADLFDGIVAYEANLRRFRLANLHLVLTEIAYEPLMHELGYPSSTDTRVFAKIDLSGLERRDVEGVIDLSTKTKRFTPTPILEDDNESFDIRTLLADEYGRIKPFRLKLSAAAALEQAGVLEQFVKLHLNGPLDARATLEGDKKLLDFKLNSSLARGTTALTLTIPDLNPSQVSLDMRHAEAAKLFELFALSPPISGTCDLSAKIDEKRAALNLTLSDAQSNPKVLKETYNLTQPMIRFDARIGADIAREGGVHYRGSFRSDLGRMEFDRNATHDQMLRDLLSTLR